MFRVPYWIFYKNVSTEATSKTVVAAEFLNTLTLFQPVVADSTHNGRGCTKNFLVDTSLCFIVLNSQ